MTSGTKATWMIAAFFGLVMIALAIFSFQDFPSVKNLFNPETLDSRIFWHLRLPRVFLAFLVGAGLSVAGVSFQSLLKNPLADPYILGVSGGAALGLVLAIATGMSTQYLPLVSMAFALVFLLIIYRLACHKGVLSVLSLLLIGIVSNAFSFAVILVVNSLVHFGQAQQILYLLLGAIDPIGWGLLCLVFLAVFCACLILFFRSRALNLLSMGDAEAFHLGLNVEREKKIIFVTTSLLVGASVAFCGMIGFVGLIVPHVVRLLFGADHRVVLPLSVVIGGVLLVACDFLAVTMFSFETLSTRLPVGAVTALIGAPWFVYLLKRKCVYSQ